MDKLQSTSEEVTQINYTRIEDTPFTLVENNNLFALLVGNVLVTEWDAERKTRNKALIKNMTWADKRFKEAAADMQEASAKLASGQNAKIEHEINLIERSLDKMKLDMNGIELDNELKKRVMESKVQEAEMSVKALMNSILVGNSQIRLNNQEAEAITDKVMQDWQSVAQQWNKLQQSEQSIEIDRERMENEAKRILILS